MVCLPLGYCPTAAVVEVVVIGAESSPAAVPVLGAIVLGSDVFGAMGLVLLVGYVADGDRLEQPVIIPKEAIPKNNTPRTRRLIIGPSSPKVMSIP